MGIAADEASELSLYLAMAERRGDDLSPPPSVPLDMVFFLFLGSPSSFPGVFSTSGSYHESPSTIDFRFVLAADERAKSDFG